MNAFMIKCMALVFMVLDHIYSFISGMPIWFNYLGRTVAPMFFFLLVESFFHTRDRKKFNIRLFIAAFVVFLIIKVMLKDPTNIFISMALNILILNLIEFIKDNRENIFKSILAFIGICVSAYLSIFTEGALSGVLMVLIFYFLRHRKFLMSLCFILISSVDFWFVTDTNNIYNKLFLEEYQWMMMFAIIPILLYNGKPGHRGKFSKYFFYVFYPAHIVILMFISKLIRAS